MNEVMSGFDWSFVVPVIGYGPCDRTSLHRTTEGLDRATCGLQRFGTPMKWMRFSFEPREFAVKLYGGLLEGDLCLFRRGKGTDMTLSALKYDICMEAVTVPLYTLNA